MTDDIELVIKIPEKLYKTIKKNGYIYEEEVEDVALSVICSTPLPKGHGDLIDKGKFKNWIETQDGDKLMTEYYLDALEMQEMIVGGSLNGEID